MGEPSGHQYQGKFFQLDDVLGVEEENGFTLNTDKYNWKHIRITLSWRMRTAMWTSARARRTFLEGAPLLQNETELPFAVRNGWEVQMAVKDFGKGRGVYISGLPYSFTNSRVLYRAVLWAATAEEELHKLGIPPTTMWKFTLT